VLVIWADRSQKEFRNFVRSKLQNLGIDYEIDDGMAPWETAKPDDVILAFGKERLAALQASGHGHKGRAIGSQRGKLLGNNCRVLVTWDASAVAFDAARRPEIIWDLKLAKRLHETGTLMPVTGDYIEVEDFSAVVDLLNGIAKDAPKIPIAVDTETVGTDYMNPEAWIVAVSMSVAKGQSYVMHFTSNDVPSGVVAQVIHILNHPRAKVYGANFKFDMLWFCQKWGIKTFDAFTLDTTLVGSLLDENRSNSLNLHAKVYTDIGGYDDPFNEQYDKSRMDLVPKQDLIQYAGGDTDAGLRVALRMRSDLGRQKRLTRFYTDLLHPAQNAVRKMEQRGMVVSLDEYKRLDDEITQSMQENYQVMWEIVPNAIKYIFADDPTLTRPKIVGDFLFSKRWLGLKPKMLSEKKKAPSMAAEHFEMFADHPKAGPFVQAFMAFKKAEKTKSTYLDGFIKHLRSDGRYHPSYMLFRGLFHGDKASDDDSGGRTGRTSVKEPAYQTVPKHTDWAKPLRRVYVPPPDMVILDVDFSQGELRITACIANEPTMIETYRQNIDLHLKTGSQLNGIELAEAIAMKASDDPATKAVIKAIRQGGKAGNFGLIYGMGAEGFVDYARKSYGVELSLREAEQFIATFFGLYNKLPDWHAETKAYAHQHKFVESPLGRIRHLPLIDSFVGEIRSRSERQAINAGVQATLTDMGLLAMAELDKRYPDLWIFGFTHDALSFYVPEDNWMDWAVRIADVMSNLPLGHFGWKPQLDFPVEVELGVHNLADTKEIELSA
jgi:DNA polymerase I-like protein with 3'-5' exonuclease and polymerase domains